MQTNRRVRRWGAVAIGLIGAATPVVAQSLPPEIEQFVGTTRINPPPPPEPVKPAEDPLVLPAAARLVNGTTAPAAAPLSTLTIAARDAGEATAAAATSSLKAMFTRMAVATEPKKLPPLKAMPEPVLASPSSTPTVIVVRDAATGTPTMQPMVIETRSAEPTVAAGWTTESLLAVGLSAAGLFSTMLLWGRVGRSAAPPTIVYAGHAPLPAAPPAPVQPVGTTLLAGYNVGPLPDTAETFDLGPSFADEKRMKVESEARNKDAMALHVLDQNLALFDDEPVAA